MKKQFYPIAKKVANLLALFLTLIILNRTDAQDVTITTDPVFWGQATVNGNLTITGNAITSLSGLSDGLFGPNLSKVTGNLIIKDCNGPLFTSLNGLQSLVEVGTMNVGGNIIIENCDFLVTLQGIEQLTLLWGDLLVSANDKLVTTGSVPYQLQRAGRIEFQNNPLLTYIDPFQFVTHCDYFNLLSNSALASYTGMNSISAAANIWISNNSSLIGINGFQNVNALNYLEITNNSLLTDCCFASHLVAISNTDVINGNNILCISPSTINAPPFFDICPPSTTVTTDPGFCDNHFPMRLPASIDNCDGLSPTVKITFGDGSIWFDGVYGSPGSTFTYPVTPGTNTFEFIAHDANGNTSACTSTITVVDAELPKPPSDFPNEVFAEAGPSCTATILLAANGFTDNCALDHYEIKIEQAGNVIIQQDHPVGNAQEYTLDIGSYTYTLTAFDHNLLSSSESATINIVDGSPPFWSESSLTKVVEIECGEVSVQQTLDANIPSATDCTGIPDVLISQTNLNSTACGLQENEYTFIARDGFGATNPETYNLIIREIDTKAPVISGIPPSITISCNDPLPPFPTLSAVDLCDGDISSSIVITEIPSMGTCDEGQAAQILSRSAMIEDICGNIAETNWTVTVISDFEFSLGDDVSLCDGSGQNITLDPNVSGANYQWSTGATSQSISVSQSGTYEVTITTGNGCCYSDEIEVTIGTIPDIFANGGTLDCTSGNVTLQGGSATQGATFLWTGPNNFTSTQSNPEVNDEGTYTLFVTDALGCESSMQIVVDSDTNIPDVVATSGNLSCTTTSVQLNGASATNNVTFQWTGPNNFSSSEQNPFVSEAGVYTLTVKGPNGCIAVATTEVFGNTDIPAVTLNAATINCNNNAVSIALESDDVLLQTEWTGPNDFQSSEREPEVNFSGTYTLTVQSLNGCETSFNIEVKEDFTTPDLTATGGTISCDANFIMLTANSSDAEASFVWTGPDNFTSGLQNPEATQPGIYKVTVISTNGCSTQDSVEVMGDTNLPEVSAIGGVIDCNNEVVTLMGSTNTANATFMWEGPNGFSSIQSENIVDIPGLYIFTVTSPSGCVAFKNVEVILDNSNPDLAIEEGVVDCSTGTRQFNVSSNAEGATYLWEGPDGYTSQENFPSYTDAGTYNVTLTASNGCTTVQSLEVENDIKLEVEIDVNGNTATTNIIGGTGPFTYIWDGDFGNSSISGLKIGEHSLSVIDAFGCSSDFDFQVTTSGIKELGEIKSINLFPNPATDFIDISVDAIELPIKYNLYDVSGRILDSSILHQKETTIDISEFKNGIYIIHFSNDSAANVVKFVKN